MMTVVTNERAESKYNLNERTTFLIADLQDAAIRTYNKYNYDTSFDKWQSIRLLIQARFSDEEKKNLDNLEEEYFSKIIISYPSGLSDRRPLNRPSQKDLFIRKEALKIKRERLKDYINYLMELLRDYKIGLTDKEKKKRLE